MHRPGIISAVQLGHTIDPFMKDFGNLFDPSEASVRSISAIASDHLELMNPAAIGKREFAKFDGNSGHATSTAKGAINAGLSDRVQFCILKGGA